MPTRYGIVPSQLLQYMTGRRFFEILRGSNHQFRIICSKLCPSHVGSKRLGQFNTLEIIEDRRPQGAYGIEFKTDPVEG